MKMATLLSIMFTKARMLPSLRIVCRASLLTHSSLPYSTKDIIGNDDNKKNDEDAHQMCSPNYWHKFYTKHDTNAFEWLVDYNELRVDAQSPLQTTTFHFLNKHSHSFTYALDAGCGTSMFSPHMIDSFRAPSLLFCADFSSQALHLHREKCDIFTQQQRKEGHCSPLAIVEHVQCDCSRGRLPFRDDMFDLIIDKGFTDSVLKNADTASATGNALATIESLVRKLDRTRVDATLVQITDEAPEMRINLLDQLDIILQRSVRLHYKSIELLDGDDNIYNHDDDAHSYFVYFLSTCK